MNERQLRAMAMVLGTVIALTGALAGVDGAVTLMAGALFGFALGTGVKMAGAPSARQGERGSPPRSAP